MHLWAIADIHLSFKSNREEFAKLQGRGPDDGLILAGDGVQRLRWRTVRDRD